MKNLLQQHLITNEVKIVIPCTHCQPNAPITGLSPGFARVTETALGHEPGAKNTAEVLERVFNRRLKDTGFIADHVALIGDENWFELSTVPHSMQPETK